jgi:lysophospholipase L1-like esterase
MMMRLAKAVLLTGLLGAVCGCTSVGYFFHRDNPPPEAAAAMVDPYAAQRPATASVGVVMPDLKDFQHPWDPVTYVMRVTTFAKLPAMNGGIAFLGDSLTEYGRWPEAYPDIRVRNFGIAGDTTVGVLHRVSQVIGASPAAVFLLIGTNDVEFGRSPEAIAANVGEILDRLAAGLPGARLYVEGLLPRQPEFDAKVRAVNALLKDAAAKRGLVFIDLYLRFVAEGRLDPRLTPDDIHLSGDGYLIWQDAIKDYVAVPVKGKQ